MSYDRVDPREIKVAQQSATCSFWNARKTFSEKSISEFAERIRTEGLTTDLTVRIINGVYQLVAGERRLRALLTLLKSNASCFDTETGEYRPARTVYGTIQVKVLPNCSDKFAIQKSVSENMAREDVSEIDLMTYCAELEAYTNEKGEKGFSRKEIGKLIRRSETWVSQTLSLFELPPRAAKALADGTIPRTVALYLLKLQPETIDLVIDRAEMIERQVGEEEFLAQEALIEQTEAKLERLDISAAAQSGLGLISSDGQHISKAREKLNRSLQDAKNRQDGLKARKPRISKQSLQTATSQIPGALQGKESAMTHKAIRKQRDRLLEEMSRGPVLHHENGLPFDPMHLAIVVRMMDLVLGEGPPTPLGMLTELYFERNVPGWTKLSVHA